MCYLITLAFFQPTFLLNSCFPALDFSHPPAALMYGFYNHFNNLRFKKTRNLDDYSAAHVVISFVSREIMICRLLKLLLAQPMTYIYLYILQVYTVFDICLYTDLSFQNTLAERLALQSVAKSRIHIYIYICYTIYLCIYIYIYIQRERERERHIIL